MPKHRRILSWKRWWVFWRGNIVSADGQMYKDKEVKKNVKDIFLNFFIFNFFRNAYTKSGSLRFSVFWLLTDFVCLYSYEFWLSLCKIVRSSVILLLPLFSSICSDFLDFITTFQTSRSHCGSEVPAVTITVFKYRNKIGKIVVKAVPYSVT
jgi:hypothetical protein